MPHCTFSPQGRLGNFFMEAFTAWSYAKKNGLKFTIPFHTSNEYWSPIYSTHLQDPTFDNTLPSITINEKHFHYAELPYEPAWEGRNIFLRGYFQDYRYWDEYREEMLDAFKFNWDLIPDTCAIHSRFGDYLTIEGKHIIVDEPYLTKAIPLITKKTGIKKFKVFSDDINYFKNKFGSLYDFEYSENKDIWSDFEEISCCHSHINSSSTFSWIAAYINRNPDKVIITQEKWFQDGWDNADTSNIIPNNWIKL